MNQTAIEVDNESLASRAEDALQQLLYSAHAFAAVAVPVSISMILSSLAIVFINDGLNGVSSGGTGIPVIFEESGDDSTDERFVSALVNALAIIGAIIGATFLMVLLYYFKFMKTLFAWLICSTALLLAFSTGLVVQTGMQLLQIPFDAISYSFIFFNFAIVGVTAVFFQKGIPPIVTGGYLIAISVTMAWILIRYLPEWTSWALLALLAFYDLCAVLTPCGPLKWLVGIMQERDEPLPGLLYEARVRTAGAAAGQVDESPYVANVGVNGNNNTNGTHAASNASVSTSTSRSIPRGAFSDVEAGYMIQEENLAPPVKPPKSAALSATVTAMNSTTSSSSASAVGDTQRASSPNVERSGQTSSVDVEDIVVARGSGASALASSSNVATSGGTQQVVSRVESRQSNGTISNERQQQARSNDQQQSRPVSINNDHVSPPSDHQHNQPISGGGGDDFLAQFAVGDEDDDRSIKLGLGDFVFYSVLCARAALVSFTTFVAVFVVVLFGLAMTLVLLAVYRTALPALPISILLGLVFFFAVDAVVVPFVNNFAFEMAFT